VNTIGLYNISTARTLNNLAIIHGNLDQHILALEYYKKLMMVLKKVTG